MSDEGVRTASPALTISNEMVRLMSRYTGRGPTKARTTLNSNICVVTFHDALTRGEKSLVEVGQTDAVLTMRRTFHEVMAPEACEAVEHVLGRHVNAFLSDVNLEANVAAMLFLLDPIPESGRVETARVDG